MNQSLEQPFLNLNYYLSLLLALFPLLPLNLSSFLIILWALSCGFTALFNKKTNFRSNLKFFLLFSAVFWFALLALTYTADLKEGWYLLEKNLSLLVFPLCLWITYPHLKKSQIKDILNVMVLATLALSIYSNLQLLITGSLNQFPAEIPFYFKYRTSLEQISRLHPTYFSLLLLFSALYLSYEVLKNKWQQLTLLRILIILALMIQAVFLASRLPLIAFSFSLIVMILYVLDSWKIRIALVLVFLVGAVAAVALSTSMQERLSELLATNLSAPVGEHYNPTNIRVGIFKCSWELISENWLTGYGYGDIQKKLDQCYDTFNTPAYKLQQYNSHNIYLNAWLGSGLPGFASVLLMLLIPAWMALKRKKYLYLSFLIFFILCGLTENILNRQIGLVFYCYVNYLLFLFSFRTDGFDD